MVEEIRHEKRRGNKSLHFNLAGDIRRCAFECRDRIPGVLFPFASLPSASS